MKKLIAALSLSMLVAGGSAYAQATTTKQNQKPRSEMRQGMKDKSPDEMAQQRTERMAQKLDLNTNQKNEVQALNKRHAQEMKAMREGHKATAEKTPQQKAQMKASRKASHDQWHTELKSILTADQYAKYEADQEQMKEKRGDGRKGAKHGDHNKSGEYKNKGDHRKQQG